PARQPDRVHAGPAPAQGTAAGGNRRRAQDRHRRHARRDDARDQRHRADYDAGRTAARDRRLHQGLDRRRSRARGDHRQDRAGRVGPVAAMSSDRQRLEAIAEDAMRRYGLAPEFPDAARAQVAHLRPPDGNGLRDLRDLPWSSIDNDDSRDLDQLEVCADAGRGQTRVLIAIADVDGSAPKDSPIDAHARANTTSVYTPAVVFPMLPLELSTDRTSLNEGEDRAAIVVDMTLDGNGVLDGSDVYRAVVHNHARLTYGAIAAWLDNAGPAPDALARVKGLDAQLRQQDRLATLLQARRDEEGALDFERSELRPLVDDHGVKELQAETSNRAREVIENFMVAANGVTARFLSAHGVASIRRVVKSPERWPRIVDLAQQHGGSLPSEPDAHALQQFLKQQRAAA